MKKLLMFATTQVGWALALSVSLLAFQARAGYFTTVTSVSTTDASSTTTGAMTTAGGLGVAKKVYVGTDLSVGANASVNGTTDASSSTTGAFTLSGGFGMVSGKKMYWGNSYLVTRNDSNLEFHAGANQYLFGNTATELPTVYTTTTGAAANVVVASGGGLARSTSSLRYKTDVRDFSGGLSDVLLLQPISFVDKQHPHGPRYLGFTAEALDAQGLTMLVTYDEQGRPDTIQYDRLTTYLVNAVKELSAEVDALKAIHNLPVTHGGSGGVDTASRRVSIAETRYRQCQKDNEVITAAGGSPIVCATDPDTQAIATEDTSKQEALSQRRAANCARLNVLIVQQGGTPSICAPERPKPNGQKDTIK